MKDFDRAEELTYGLALDHEDNWKDTAVPTCDFVHLKNMHKNWDFNMSDIKKCQWLGWMQGIIVAGTYPYTNLEMFKQINLSCQK